jgi:hypothetical protein
VNNKLNKLTSKPSDRLHFGLAEVESGPTVFGQLSFPNSAGWLRAKAAGVEAWAVGRMISNCGICYAHFDVFALTPVDHRLLYPAPLSPNCILRQRHISR